MPAPGTLRIALCQINTVPGDIPGNVARILDQASRAGELGAHLAVFPELAVEGYCPRDLLSRRSFVEASEEARRKLAASFQQLPMLVGCVLPCRDGRRPLYNGAVLLREGEEAARFTKTLLPEYDVFDEARYFEPGAPSAPFSLRGHRVGVTICEDLWFGVRDPEVPRYDTDPAARVRELGADLIVTLSASPYSRGRPALREEIIRGAAERVGCPVMLCNLAGANDEIIFDGASCAVGEEGTTRARADSFDEDLLVVDARGSGPMAPLPGSQVEELHRALVLGIRDYARKCGFHSAVIGLSGGVDSALTAALAREAFGASRITGIAFPSRFSSEESLADARDLAELLGIAFHVVPINEAYKVLCALARRVVGPGPFGVMEENIQARVRGLLLMAFANHSGDLLISTGNKSEMAVGYCTLYGDMSGGLAAISDVFKTEVYRLARMFQDQGLIPPRVLTKPPSAELRPGQKDSDSLPPYELMDPVLELHIEHGLGAREIEVRLPGTPAEDIRRVLRLVARNEYKRKQAPPGLRVSRKAFGFGRRIPIVAAQLAHLQLD